jgi:two-component system sensor histidine kinase PilS (NtrC family)
MNEILDKRFEEQQSVQRSTIFKVYNYYRILISFLFLFLFLDPNFSEFVGTVNPELFRSTILAYLGINILIGLTTLFVRVELLSKTTPALIVLIGDIVGLTLLVSASGGVSSGLGNFLIFSVAFGGGLVTGRVSTVLPAIAFILTIYTEFYLFFLDENSVQSFFQAGILGVVYFVANILFQTLSRALRTRESEVHTLEQINQLVIERLRIGVAVVSSQGEPRLINQAAENLLGIRGGTASAKASLPKALLDNLNEWKHGKSVQPTKFAAHKAGPELLVNFSVLNAPSKKPDTLVFIEDSTDVQKQAQQLKLASLGRLSASIAHEIRNPLGAISHAAQLLGESEDLNSGDKRLSEIIQNHTVRLNGVIENVLQMSRRQAPQQRTIKLGDWLINFVDEFSAGISEEAEIEIEMKVSEIAIFVDPLHLTQILANLCQNGLRYSERKTGAYKIRISGDIDSMSSYPYLEIEDYGEGINEEQEANLFEPFYTTETSGTGLGLYLSKELCEANHARLSYTRANGGGSCFKITFLSDPQG